MTWAARTFPRGLRERLALWLLGDRPVISGVVVLPAAIVGPVDPERVEILFARRAGCDLSDYDAEARALREAVMGDLPTLPAGLVIGREGGAS